MSGPLNLTGYKGWTTLEQYYVDDNTPTGIYKDNISTDPDYVAPIFDTSVCWVANYQISFGSATDEFAWMNPNRYYVDPSGETFTIYVYSNYDELSFYLSNTSGFTIVSVSGISNNCTVTIQADANSAGFTINTFLVATHGGADLWNMRIDQNSL